MSLASSRSARTGVAAVGFLLAIGFLQLTEHRAQYEEWAHATPRFIPAVGRSGT